MLKFKGEMLEDIQREKWRDDGRVVLHRRSSFWCVISHGHNWRKICRRPFQNKVSEIFQTSLGTAQSALSGGMRRGRLKKKKKNGTQASTPPFAFQLFTTHLSGNSNAKIAAIASSRFFLWALQIWLGWQPYATKLREPVKKTPSVLNWQLGAGGRAGSDLICLPRTGASSLQAPPRWAWKKGCEGEVHGRRRKVLLSGQYLMLLLKYSGKEKGIFLQQPLLLCVLKFDLRGFHVWEPLAT